MHVCRTVSLGADIHISSQLRRSLYRRYVAHEPIAVLTLTSFQQLFAEIVVVLPERNLYIPRIAGPAFFSRFAIKGSQNSPLAAGIIAEVQGVEYGPSVTIPIGLPKPIPLWLQDAFGDPGH